jgi:hypothetical protein
VFGYENQGITKFLVIKNILITLTNINKKVNASGSAT